MWNCVPRETNSRYFHMEHKKTPQRRSFDVGEPGSSKLTVSVPQLAILSRFTLKIAQSGFDSRHKTKKAQENLDFLHFVGEPGIEPGPLGPKPSTLPLCYTPMREGCGVAL